MNEEELEQIREYCRDEESHRRLLEMLQRSGGSCDPVDRYRLIFEHSPESIVLLDRAGLVIDVNGRIADTIGYRPEEALGRSLAELPFLTPESRRLTAEHFARRMRGENDPPYEIEFIHKSGELRTGRVHATPFRDEEGGISGSLVMLADITDQKRAEERLRRSEASLAEAERLARLGSWVWQVQTGELTWSEGIYLIIGYGREEIEFSFQVFLERIVHPEDRRLVVQAVEDALCGRRPYELDCRIIVRSGEVRVARVHGEMFYGPDGTPLRMIGAVQDVTELRRAEERQQRLFHELHQKRTELDTILGSVADAILSLDLELRITLANPAFCELTGLREEEIRGRHCREVLGCEDEQGRPVCGECDLSRETLVTGRVTAGRTLIRNRSGNRATVQSVNAPLRDEQGRTIGVVKTMRDVSREAEIERMKNDFVATVSHELRTPLTSISGYLDLILEGDTGPVNGLQQEFLGIVRSNAERLRHLIDDLLDVEKIEAGRIQLKLSPVRLDRLVAEAVRTMDAAAARGGLELAGVIPGAVEVEGDPDRLTQVLINLLSNAVKFTPQGRVEVTLKSVGSRALVTVRDTGIGISREDQARLFDKFFRADNEYTRRVGGTGLGLSIVKAIVELHGGEVRLESEPGVGTTVRVWLPLSGAGS